jgi:hypothetical protein
MVRERRTALLATKFIGEFKFFPYYFFLIITEILYETHDKLKI